MIFTRISTDRNIKNLTAETRMQQFVVTKCLNALTASKEVLKINQEVRMKRMCARA
jgi:hypothetical protein